VAEWTTKSTGQIVQAEHINTLQTEKLDRDGTMPMTGMTLGPSARNLKTGGFFTDFIEGDPRYSCFYTAYASGAGAVATHAGGSATRPGILYLGTGTTAAGYAYLKSGGNAFGLLFGGGVYTFETELYLGILSTAIEEYGIAIGFGDEHTLLNQTDGAYFKYDRAVTGVNWQAVTSNNSDRTTTDTGVAVDTNYHKFKIVVNAAGTSVDFYIDGALVATIATNIPTGAGRSFGIVENIVKTVGLTSRVLYGDWLWFHYDLTVSR
jgi:hypothetical protein